LRSHRSVCCYHFDKDEKDLSIFVVSKVHQDDVGQIAVGRNFKFELRGQLVINLFMEASTRTRVSFEIAEKRLKNSAFYDERFARIPALKVPPRDRRVRHSFVTYQLFAERRDELEKHCAARGIECKIHYPIPAYAQKGLQHLGYRPGDFPVADRHARTTITLPVHQYLTRAQLEFVADTVSSFYRA